MQPRGTSSGRRSPLTATGGRRPLFVGVAIVVLAVAVVLAGRAFGPAEENNSAAGVGGPDPAEERTDPGPPETFASVDGDVDVDDWLIPAWEQNLGGDYPAFRMFCEFSHMGYYDPIVSPGDDEFMHLHMFFGNTEADHRSTYESLRTRGGSTCDGGPLNRSAYWMPAVFDGDGEVVVPEQFELYYKGENAEDPSAIQAKPNGLRMIAGAPDEAELVWGWRCEDGPDSATIPDCEPGQRLTGWVRFPYCWDGDDLDSPDHRSHLAYGTNNTWGSCPESHPIHLPELTEFVHFDDAAGSGEWYLSSDRMDPNDPKPNGSTFHADWFGAWDNETQDRWTDNCIRSARSASNGNLCDGEQLRPAPDHEGARRLSGWLPGPHGGDGGSHGRGASRDSSVGSASG